MNMAAPVETTGTLAEASALQAQYGHLDGTELLEVMIKDVFKDRIALVSSFGSEFQGGGRVSRS